MSFEEVTTADNIRRHLAGDHSDCQHGWCFATPAPDSKVDVREKRIQRLILAWERSEPGSVRRHAIKRATFRLLYPLAREMYARPYRGTVTGRLACHSPSMQQVRP